LSESIESTSKNMSYIKALQSSEIDLSSLVTNKDDQDSDDDEEVQEDEDEDKGEDN